MTGPKPPKKPIATPKTASSKTTPPKASMAAPTRKCKSCRRYKDLGNYARNGQHYRTICNPCRNKQRQAVRAVTLKEAVQEYPNLDQIGGRLPKTEVLVVSWAQNSTPVHEPFLASIKTYMRHRKAAFVVVPGRYRNPTSVFPDAPYDIWAKELAPYLYKGKMTFGGVLVCGGVPIQPTAARPLSRMAKHARNRPAIFGHPKIQVDTIGTNTRKSRTLMTTGAVTRKNYTDSREGHTSGIDHIIGALVIEKSGGRTFTRHIIAEKDGSFIDLDTRYTPKGVEPAPRPLSLTMGDLHVDRIDPGVLEATFGPGGIVETLRPQNLIAHDVMDFGRRNHHSINDPRLRLIQALGVVPDDVEGEVRRTIEFLDTYSPKDAKTYVVASNHDEAFDRWLLGKQPEDQGDYLNAEFFHFVKAQYLGELRKRGLLSIARQEARGKTKGTDWLVDFNFPRAFALMYQLWGKGKAIFLERNDDLMIGRVDHAFHGDKGLNGARGSITGLDNLGTKTTSGHSHTPRQLGGAMSVGTSSKLDMGYNTLPSSWAHAHVLQYGNGKRTFLFIHDGRWRAD